MNAPFRTGRILPDLTQFSVKYRGPRGGKTAPRKSKGIDDGELRRLFEDGLDDRALAAHFGRAIQMIREHRWALKLHRPRGGMGRAGSAQVGVASRHIAKPVAGKVARMPSFDHPALVEARTLYPATVVPVAGLNRILVGGENSWKIGSLIAKGKWKGFPVYTLTLQERATCPTSCQVWRSCYGNSMHLAKRIAHDADFEDRLRCEVGVLAYRHSEGFAVRLHVLGDFYSIEYVALWRALVERHPNLRIFGFTARIDPDDPITKSLHDFVLTHWPRVGLRFSNAPTPILSTVTIEHPLQRPVDAIICPAQLGKTANCGTCALCWSTERRIAFLRH